MAHTFTAREAASPPSILKTTTLRDPPLSQIIYLYEQLGVSCSGLFKCFDAAWPLETGRADHFFLYTITKEEKKQFLSHSLPQVSSPHSRTGYPQPSGTLMAAENAASTAQHQYKISVWGLTAESGAGKAIIWLLSRQNSSSVSWKASPPQN